MSESVRPLILVVDDEPVVLSVISRQVEHLGYLVDTAADATEAVMLCRERAPAAVVLDVRMPEIDGPATLDLLRTVAPRLPCVFVSGDPRPHTVPDLLARGAVVFVAKPFRLPQLESALAALVPSILSST